MKLNYRRELISEGRYAARIVAVSPEQTECGETLRILHKVLQPGSPYDGIVVSALVSAVAAGRTRLTRWFEAAMQTALLGEEESDTDLMVGRCVTITIKLKKGKDGETFPHIADVEYAS